LSRRQVLAGSAGILTSLAINPGSLLAQEAKPGAMGVVIHSYGIRSKDQSSRFNDPLAFIEYCRNIGAAGVQTGLGVKDDAAIEKIRQTVAAAKMYLEGIIRLPRSAADTEQFTKEVNTAKACGAGVVRSVLLDSRRYEVFDSAETFRKFADECGPRLALARPIVEKAGVQLAIENHKDWRADDLVRIIRQANSPQIGICVDTGNSIALLEEPHELVEALAPLAFTTHFKDMAVAEYADGFLLSEVPLGTGFLDLPRVVKLLREKRPDIRFNLEMITRDPLQIPCLTPRYWKTFENLPARYLADTLALVRRKAAATPLPRIADQSPAERLTAEDANVRACLAYAQDKRLV
jgi:sugar phosphate isomerase/epimerase